MTTATMTAMTKKMATSHLDAPQHQEALAKDLDRVFECASAIQSVH
jgi:hypothetical protein